MIGPPTIRIPIFAVILALIATGLPTAASPGNSVQTLNVKMQFRTRVLNIPMTDGKGLRFHRLSTTDGLSQTRVAQIVQDDEGFLWFGTQYGLNRFDGYRFKVFAHDPTLPDSLGGVYITVLFKDRSGVLWVGCDQFLDRFDRKTETFQHFLLDANDPDRASSSISVEHVFQDPDGMLWCSTGKGLYRLDPATGRIARFTHDPANPASIGNNDIKSTGQDRSGAFWVGHSTGLDRMDLRTGKVDLHLVMEESGSGLKFHQDRYGLFWILFGESGKLGVLDGSARTLTLYKRIEDGSSLNRWNPITKILEDSDGDHVVWHRRGWSLAFRPREKAVHPVPESALRREQHGR